MEEVYGSAAFKRLMAESKDRLARGAVLRAQMQRQLEAGLPVTGYRVTFLAVVSRDIMSLLCAAAERFNRDHPDDLLSTADMLDCLATSRSRLLDAVQKLRSTVAQETER